MKKKSGIVIIIAVILFAAVVGILYSFPLSVGGKSIDIPKPLAAETVLTAEQVIEDRDKAIEYMEEIHPYFILVEDQSDYEDAKQKYIQTAASEMSVRDFQAATAEYIGFFQDGHTRLAWKEEEYVDVKSTYHDGKTYVVKDGEITDVYIESFGGVEVETIYEIIDKMFPAENEMAQAINRYNYVDGRNFLSYVGAEIIEDKISVAFSDGTEGVFGFYNPSEVATATEEQEYTGNSWYMDGDIFVVDSIDEAVMAVNELAPEHAELLLEDCEDDSNGKEKCTYSKKWSSSVIDDGKFASGYNNPDKMPYQEKTILMSNVKLGEFKLNDVLLEQLSTKANYNELSESVASSRNMYVIDGYYTTYSKDEEIEIGDVRISFKYNDASDISVMGVQNNNSFAEFKTEKNDYQRPSNNAIMKFKYLMEHSGKKVTVRLERGADIDAACGQLRAKKMMENK